MYARSLSTIDEEDSWVEDLPNPSMYYMSDKGMGEVDGIFSKIGGAFKKAKKVVVPALRGYSSGGFAGAASAITSKYLDKKPRRISLPTPAAGIPNRFAGNQQLDPQFQGDNSWVWWAGGGVLLLGAVIYAAKS